MSEASEFRGGVFSDKLEKRRGAGRIELRANELVMLTDSGETLMLPYSRCQLRMGGNAGNVTFCRNNEGSLEIFCSDVAFPAALRSAANGLLDDQVDGILRGQRNKRRRSWLLNLAGLLLVVSLLVGGYYGIMAAARTAVMALPTNVDRQVGDQAMQSIDLEGPKVDDPVVVGAMQHIVDRLSPHVEGDAFNFKVTVVDAPIENAFALPGGQIVIYTGLIKAARDPEELAGVVAHEMAHVTKRHGMQRVGQSIGISVAIGLLFGDTGGLTRHAARVLGSGAINSYSRAHETEADAVGVRALYEADVNPMGLANFFQTMRDEHGDQPALTSWMSTHPQHATRIRAVREHLAQWPEKKYRPLAVDWKKVQSRLR